METRKVVVVLLILAIVFSGLSLVFALGDTTTLFSFGVGGDFGSSGGQVAIQILDNGVNSG